MELGEGEHEQVSTTGRYVDYSIVLGMETKKADFGEEVGFRWVSGNLALGDGAAWGNHG